MRLRMAVDYINQYHSDADFCVISGDLTDGGDVASYQLVDEIMSGCEVPTLSIPGNHDDRAIMRAQLSFPENIDAEFIQYSIIKKITRPKAFSAKSDLTGSNQNSPPIKSYLHSSSVIIRLVNCFCQCKIKCKTIMVISCWTYCVRLAISGISFLAMSTALSVVALED